MIIHCYPKYFKNSTSSYLFVLKLLCKLTHHLSTYFSNICILPEILPVLYFWHVEHITYGFSYISVFLQKMLISYIFCKDVLPKCKLPFPQLLSVFGISRFLRIYLPVGETSLRRVMFSSVCYVMIIRFHSQKKKKKKMLIALWVSFAYEFATSIFLCYIIFHKKQLDNRKQSVFDYFT